MRAITLCPSCQTQFFVTAEQLEKHQGKVRCGECSHVFVATAHLIAAEDSDTSNTNVVAISNESTSQLTSVDRAHHIDASSAITDDAITTDLPDTLGDYVPSGKRKSWFASRLQRNGKTHPKWLVYGLSFICLLLVLSAVGQVIFAYRSAIAANFPNTSVYLKQLCIPLKCTIELPQNIALIVIDDSDIQEDADFSGALRFTSTLKNQANFRQAYPNIELTLTDLNDKALLRRTLKPADYLPRIIKVKDGFAAGETVSINLAILAKEVVVSGYRVAITY